MHQMDPLDGRPQISRLAASRVRRIAWACGGSLLVHAAGLWWLLMRPPIPRAPDAVAPAMRVVWATPASNMGAKAITNQHPRVPLAARKKHNAAAVSNPRSETISAPDSEKIPALSKPIHEAVSHVGEVAPSLSPHGASMDASPGAEANGSLNAPNTLSESDWAQRLIQRGLQRKASNGPPQPSASRSGPIRARDLPLPRRDDRHTDRPDVGMSLVERRNSHEIQIEITSAWGTRTCLKRRSSSRLQELHDKPFDQAMVATTCP